MLLEELRQIASSGMLRQPMKMLMFNTCTVISNGRVLEFCFSILFSGVEKLPGSFFVRSEEIFYPIPSEHSGFTMSFIQGSFPQRYSETISVLAVLAFLGIKYKDNGETMINDTLHWKLLFILHWKVLTSTLIKGLFLFMPSF